MDNREQLRIYNPAECAVFCKTKEKYGEISNMSAGFFLEINDVKVLTSEALYQTLRFPLNPEIQRNIINQVSPMTAKMVGKPYREEFCRKDFDMLRITFMRWCLRVKLLQNWRKFSGFLLSTGDRPIVELSTKRDDFWGAVIIREFIELRGKKPPKKMPRYIAGPDMPLGHLAGYNIMGRLAQELRENIKTGKDEMSSDFTILKPLEVENFLFLGNPIREVVRK